MCTRPADSFQKAFIALVLWLTTARVAAGLEVDAPGFTARFERGALVGLTDGSGAARVRDMTSCGRDEHQDAQRYEETH